ncbi:tRNA (N6-threonylcarbamoyladenosine(37)-N6)-methyltransferase TrmO [Shigella flexneri]
MRSPYKEKFAVPAPARSGKKRQRRTVISLLPTTRPTPFRPGSVRRYWILFVFHQTMEGGWRPTVASTAPLGGNARIGGFATRSSSRPNPIGMSLVELKEVVCHKGSVILKLGSLDLVDGSPVVDMNPYLPFAEWLPMPVRALRECASCRDGGEFCRRGRKAAFDAGEALSAVNAVYPRSAGAARAGLS